MTQQKRVTRGRHAGERLVTGFRAQVELARRDVEQVWRRALQRLDREIRLLEREHQALLAEVTDAARLI